MKPRTFAARSRAPYAGLLLITAAAGLASRRFPDAQPDWVARYAGDTLWAAMVFWLFALAAPRARTAALGLATVAVAFTIEASQLLHLPWLDALRATQAGALVLGQGFLWSDLWCYAVGAGVAVVVDRLVSR